MTVALWLACAWTGFAADEPGVSLCEAPVTETARKYLGTPYARAGEAPERGFDCSGFTKYVFSESCGFTLPRSSYEQAKAGVKIAKEALQPGDLVVFREPRRLHMGLYLGEGKFIHSPNRRGKVRVESLESGHFKRTFREGRRVLEPVDLTGIYQLAQRVEASPEPPQPAVKKRTPAKKTVIRKAPGKKKSPAPRRKVSKKRPTKKSAPR